MIFSDFGLGKYWTPTIVHDNWKFEWYIMENHVKSAGQFTDHLLETWKFLGGCINPKKADEMNYLLALLKVTWHCDTSGKSTASGRLWIFFGPP